MTELSRRGKVFATIGIALSLFLAALDQSIVGNAMPRIISEFHGLEHYAWVVTSYLVASTTMTPISGKLGDLFGRKPLLLVGMAGLVLASVLCGQAQNMTQLIAFRGVQGLFAGTIMACVFASLGDIFPPHVRARMAGMFSGIFGLSSVVGPTLGGYLTDTAGWRWVFYVNVPVGAAAIAAVALALPARPHNASWRDIDFAGAALLAASLVPLLLGFSLTRDYGFVSAPVLGLFAFAAVMSVVFYRVEQRTAHPVVPFAMWKNRTFAISMLTGFCFSFAMFGAIIYVSLVYQGVLGIKATDSGLLVTPFMLGMMLTSSVTGALMLRVKRYRYIGTAGAICMTIGLLRMAQVVPDTPESSVVIDLVMIGAGIGVSMPLYITAVMSAMPPQYLGVVSSQSQFWRNIGSTVGVSILGAVLAQQLHEHVNATLMKLKMPAEVLKTLAGGTVNGTGGGEQAMFNPAHLAEMRGALPEALRAGYDQGLLAMRGAMAESLHSVFLYAAGAGVLAIILSLLLKEVSLRAAKRPAAT